MRVLDLNTLYIDGGEGGVNTYLREKARCLGDRAGFPGEAVRHTIVVPGAATRRSSLGSSGLYTIRSPRILGNAQHRVLVDFTRVKAILEAERPDVVEVDSSYFLARVAARVLARRHVPIIGFHHVHLPLLYTRPSRNWLRHAFSKRTEPLAWRYTRYCTEPCDRLVVTTQDMHARLERRALPRLEVVPLGVNLDIFRPRAGGARPAVPGVDPTRPVILHVGRLSAEKDLDVLYDAHAILLRQCGAQLVVAGDGPLRRQAARLARSRAGFVYLGICPYGEQLAQLYRSADVLAVPGRNESFSLIVLEAFASGLPVVAVSQGGPSEICRPGLGELARPGDAGDFAAKVRLVLASGISGSACRRHVESSCSWEQTFGRLLKVYECALEATACSSRSEGRWLGWGLGLGTWRGARRISPKIKVEEPC
ncbi:MAG TPA: glycosyltransferase [Planctomycetota bacterium]|nr:glycosyltransferase [Planctomycetota bacterium]